MDDKNLNPQQPDQLPEPIVDLTGSIPEDMPQLDLDGFAEEPVDSGEIPMINLFPEQPAAEPEIEPELPHEPVFDEPMVFDAPAEEPASAQPEFVFDPAPAEYPAEEPSAVEFSDSDSPVDVSIPEPTPESGVPAEDSSFPVYPMEDESPVYPAEEPVISCFDQPNPVDGAEDMTLLFAEPDYVSEADIASSDPQPAADVSKDAVFAEMTEDIVPPAEPAAPKTPHPVRKGRPRRKKGDTLFGLPSLLATLIWLAIIVMIGVSLGRMLWVCAADVLAFGRESKEVVVTITNDDTIDDISEKLKEKGLIRYSGLFRLYASLAVDEGEISPGTYTLNTILDYHALVGQMSPSSSSRAVVEDVLIPEGYNCRQIFELLEQNGICTVEALEEYAANGEFQDFWFLEGVERGDKYCLEGYLFPDTYDFYAGSTPREAIGKMLLGFESRFTEELYSQLPALNERLSQMMRSNGCSQEFIDSHQLGLRELLTVASLIEEETSGAPESPAIASVIYNRLTQDQEYERYLGIDAAIIYATGDAEHIDTSIDHPYNTYKHAGLTPGPISNPGLSSITAALNFLDTDYYYYVLNPSTGEHQFSKTYEEHQEWVEKFKEMEPTEG